MVDAGGQGQGQSRIDIEGRGGTKFLGNILQHTTFHTVFIGRLVGAGERNSTLGLWHLEFITVQTSARESDVAWSKKCRVEGMHNLVFENDQDLQAFDSHLLPHRIAFVHVYT
jgi:hypothetical protein